MRFGYSSAALPPLQGARWLASQHRFAGGRHADRIPRSTPDPNSQGSSDLLRAEARAKSYAPEGEGENGGTSAEKF